MPKDYEQDSPAEPAGFDVTCVIGRVEFDALTEGLRSPNEAAMALIARHDAEGTYTYPMQDGRSCHVTVEYTGGPR